MVFTTKDKEKVVTIMNKNKKWMLAISVATMLTANNLVMAASAPDREENIRVNHSTASAQSDFAKKEGMKDHHKDNMALLQFLKLDAQTFETARKDGKSLITIAKEHGISEQELKDFMVEQMTKHMEERAKEGKLPENKKSYTRADIEKHVSDMMNGKGNMHHNHGQKHHAAFDKTKLLELLKMSDESLKNEMKAGKTLVEIGKEHGVSEEMLKTTLAEQMLEHIEKGVKAGRISADKAEQMKANIEKHVSDMMNGKRPMHSEHNKERNNH